MPFLRSVLVLAMALGLVVPGNWWVELAKVPALLAHFAHHDHDADGHQQGFFELLAMHYSDDAHHDVGHQEHSGLPFSGHQPPVQITVNPALAFAQPNLVFISTPIQVMHLVPATDPPDSRSGPSVWQPPKTA